MSLLKSALRTRAVQAALGGLVAAHMAMVKRTTRWEWQNFEAVSDIVGNGEGLIALTWHSRFLMLNSAWRREWQMPHVLISRSRDGDIVHYTSRALGLRTVRGSTRKAKGTGNAILSALEAGACIVITPDGPRGPRQRLPVGPLRLARASGAPIVPCTFAASRRKQFGSWDRFVLPGWFGRGIIRWGTPIWVDPDTGEAEMEAMRSAIEAEMNADLGVADAALGHGVVGAA